MEFVSEAEKIVMKNEASRATVKCALFCNVRAVVKLLLLALLICLSIGILSACDNEKKLILVYGNGMPNGVYDEETYVEPTRDGYIFKGWYLSESGGLEIDLSEFQKQDWEGEIEVYARWQPLPQLSGIIVKNNTVDWDGNMHSVEVENVPDGATVHTESYSDAGTYHITVTVEKEGYTPFVKEALLTIMKAKISKENIPVSDAQYVYDGEAHSIEVGQMPEGIVSYTVQNNGRTEVGEQQVTFSFEVDKNHEPVDDIVVTLKIYKEEYSVVYIQEDGTRVERKVVAGGTVADVPEVNPKNGYEGRWDAEAVEVQNDMEIHAVYDLVTYTVVYKDGEEELFRQTYDVTSPSLELYMSDERKGYDFDGWYDDGQKVERLSPDIARNIELTGKWIAKVYTVRYVLNGGVNDTANLDPTSQIYTYTIESETKILAPAYRMGYDFVRWENEQGVEVRSIVKGEIGDMVLSAVWKIEEFTLTYDYTYDNKTEETKYNYETPPFELKTPDDREGYVFVGWKIENDTYTEFIPTDWMRDVTATARWEKVVVKVTVRFFDDGRQLYSNQMKEGEQILYKPEEKFGYTFKCWKDIEGNVVQYVGKEDVDLYAEWDLIEYTITYYDNDNSVMHEDRYTVLTEEDPVLYVPEARLGYEFVCWQDYSGTEDITRLEKTYRNERLYAKWKKLEFVITYSSDGEIVHKDVYDVDTQVMPKMFTPSQKRGYKFEGWFCNGEKVETIEKTFENIDLEAKWSAIQYTITYKDGDRVVYSQTYTVETDSMPELFEYETDRAGYRFVCWRDPDEKEVRSLDKMLADVTLHAYCERIQYQIVYKDGGVEVYRDSFNVDTETMPPLYTPMPKTGYDFYGWSENGSKVEALTKELRDMELEAVWTPKTFSVYYYDGNDLVHEDNFTYENEPPELWSPDLKQGYRFLHWEDADGNEKTSLNKEHYKTYLYAKWQLIVYKVIYKDGDMQIGEPQTYTAETEEMPTLFVPADRPGYTFDGWYIGDVKVEQLVKTYEDITLNGKWTAIKYTVTYTDGERVVYTQNFTADENMPSLFVPEDRQGYNFDGWYENGEKVTELKMEYRNISLEAHWELLTYTITYYDKDDCLIGEPQTYTAGTEMPALREPEEILGYKFEGWFIKSENGGLGDRVEALTKTYHNLVLKGKWTAIEYHITYVDGGTQQVDAYTVESGLPPMHMPEAKRGYEFDGWYEGDVKVLKLTMEYRDVRLEAHWNLITYKILYMDGDSEIGNDSYNAETDPMPSLRTPRQKDGYSFDGWYIGEDRVETLEKTYDDIILTGKWTAIVYHIYYYDDENLLHTDDFTAENEMPALFTPTDKQGYSFVGWLDVNNEKVVQLTLRYEDITLQANWEEIVYNIVYYDAEEIVHTDTYTISTSQMPPLYKLDDKEGFTFVGWFDGDVEVKEIVKEFKNVELHAKWQAISEQGDEESAFLYEDVDGGVRITGLKEQSATIIIPATLNGKAVVDIASGALTSDILSLEIAANIQVIKKEMFALCVNLTELILPAAAVELEEFLLDGLDKLEKLTVPFVGLKEYHEGDLISTSLMHLFGAEMRVGLYEVIAYNVQYNDNDNKTVYDNDSRYMPESLKQVKILRGGIPDYSMRGCSNIEEVDATGERIGEQSLMNCTSLKTLILRGVCNIHLVSLYGDATLKDIYLIDCDCKEALDEALTKAKATAQIHEQSES